MNLVDTSGWLEYFFDKPNAPFFEPAINNAQGLVVSSICIYEVFKKASLIATRQLAFEIVAQMKRGVIVNVDEQISLLAASLSIQHKLPMADALIYASSKATNATLWTQDSHFKYLPGINFCDNTN